MHRPPAGRCPAAQAARAGRTALTATAAEAGQAARVRRCAARSRSSSTSSGSPWAASGLKTVATGNSAQAGVGQKVVAIGNAGGKGGTPSLVSGRIVSLGASVTATDDAAGTRERLSGLIGHNAPIKPGDSGGALVTRAGKVIGINTAASSAHGFRLQGQTQAFAVPINQAVSIANRIEAARGSAKVHIGATGFVGVAVVSADQAQLHGGPAGSGGL